LKYSGNLLKLFLTYINDIKFFTKKIIIMRLNIFYFILVTLFVTACNQEELGVSPITSDATLQAMVIGDSGSNKEDGKNGDGKEDKGKEDCFELVYPLSVTMPDGSVLSGEKEDLWEAVKTWYEANPNSEEKPSLNYPVDILWLKDEVTKNIYDENEMEIAKKYCDEGKEGNKDCFELVYPVTWTMSDGTNITMSDEEDWDAIKAWYEANSNSEEKPSLNYPVDIEFENGTTQIVNNEDEMVMVKKDCE
jgi:hypothetical protein